LKNEEHGLIIRLDKNDGRDRKIHYGILNSLFAEIAVAGYGISGIAFE
jgi:hypothetical protein